MNHAATLFGHTPGSRLHDGESLYGRLFNAFPEGSLAAVAVGMAKAAINEYAHIVKTRNAGPSAGFASAWATISARLASPS